MTRRTRSASVPIAGLSQPPRTGTVRWRSRPSARRYPEVTSACATKPGIRSSCCLCGAPISADVVRGLLKPRLERAIGVIYRPKTELESHYFQAILPRQFDEYIWFDETKAITPLTTEKLEGLPDTYPFGL